jgi:tRNA pseudouridine38-40 synthase
MQRWKLTLTYDGTPYRGWQVQPGLATVQGTLALAIRHIVGEDVLPQGSGRTDTGVHALGQVASFDLEARIPGENLLRALNRALPASIRVLEAEVAAQDFHARHSALRKTYEYRVFPGAPSGRVGAGRICPPFLAPYVWDCPWPISLELANEAAAQVLGEHDFTSFAASDPDLAQRESPAAERSMVRTILASAWAEADGLLVYRVTGTGFLHHMVRNLVGTFVDAAAGRIAPESIAAILAARDRRTAGPTAPARGLFLVSVEYADCAPLIAPSSFESKSLAMSGSGGQQ